ncbi:MAG: energy-coupling factor ABC transporter substrate-binding protein [Thermoanaerobacteraceae bacterium]|nr:energy-coupling factor ABC transporter substrate-binding protein [Thermoanaerobacteraceae bacterium]
MRKNIVLLLLAVVIVFMPLVINPDAEYSGADSEAEAVIAQIQPDAEPWFTPLWEPPSGEIESLLFALQAAAGAGVICYFLGYHVGKRKGTGAEQ